MTTQETEKEVWALRLAERVTGFLEKPAVRIAVPILVTLIALVVLHELSQHVKWADVQLDVANTSWSLMFVALFWTCLSFLSLSMYDVFAVQSVAKGEVPLTVA